MAKIVPDALYKLFPGAKAAANFESVVAGLDVYGVQAGLDKPHRLCQYLAQLAHESGGFALDREIWGPTVAQKRYDTRTDMGNTPAVDGDGRKYLGRTGIQLTGRANYWSFWNWCKTSGLNPPNFVETPDAVNTDPWEGLAPIWFWSINDLNVLADANDIEQITKRINGGLNGYADRLLRYTHIGLVVCGFAPSDIHGFQEAAKQKGFYSGGIDGDSGPQTRAAIHKWLAALSDTPVAVAPVVEKQAVAVAPKGAEKTGVMRMAGAVAMVGPTVSAAMPSGDWPKLIFLGIGLVAVAVLLWRGEVIAARVKSVLASFEG